MRKKKTDPTGVLMLTLAAVIWGSAFVAQSVAMDSIGPFTFSAVRNVMGGMFLLPLVILRRNRAGVPGRKEDTARIWKAGLICGTFLCIASNLQQVGIMYTSVGKSGFITAMYIVLVPVLGMVIGKKTDLLTWLGVALAVLGLYLLCMTEKMSFGKGDLLTLGCAFVFALHILSVDALSQGLDGVKISCIQFLVCSVLSGIVMLFTEHPTLQLLWDAKIPLLYTGIMSSGIAFTLQIVGQQLVEPTLASLLMSLESVVSVLAGWLILKQVLTGRELAGCAVMFAAIILAQLPRPQKR